MGNAANRAKTRWYAANYTQIKAYVSPDIAIAFKAACAADRVSMNSALSQFMADYGQMHTTKKPATAIDYVSTNRKRRKKHEELLHQYTQLRDAQEDANDNVHENFHYTESFEAAVERVAKLDEAVEILEDLY